MGNFRSETWKKIIFVLDWSLKWFWFCLSWKAEMPVFGTLVSCLVSYYLAFSLTKLETLCENVIKIWVQLPIPFGEHQKNLSYESLWCKYALYLIISTAICEPCVLSHCLNYISSCLQLMYTHTIPLSQILIFESPWLPAKAWKSARKETLNLHLNFSPLPKWQ